MIVKSAETAEVDAKEREAALREVMPATKADVDRLFDEVRRLQDTVSLLVRGDGGSAG